MISEVFKQNVKWNINQIIVLFTHAENVKGRARSGYYKSALMIAASVVEALSFKLLEGNGHMAMPKCDYECKNSQFLNENFKSINGEKLSICERYQPTFKLDRHTDFKKIIDVLLELKIITKPFFDKIDKIRVLRNKIHLQGQESLDRSYTQTQLEKVNYVMYRLLLMVGK